MKDSKKVDKDALVREWDKLGVTASQASQELGFSINYFSQCFRSGRIPEYTRRLIKFRYGIDESVYCLEDPKNEIPSTEETSEILKELRLIRQGIESLVAIWGGGDAG